MKNPTITVFLPYYNDFNFLKQSIDSILSQTFSDFELILLDHASTDGSNNIAHSYNDSRIKHIAMKENIGGGGGLLLIEALKIAKGKYFKPFCADDVMLPNCLEILYNYLENNQDKQIVFGNKKFIDKDGNNLPGTWWDGKPQDILNCNNIQYLNYYLHYNSFLPWPSSMFYTKIIDTNIINKTFIIMFDMSFWLQLIIKNYQIGCIAESVCLYRRHENQAVNFKKNKIKRQIIKNIRYFEQYHYSDYFFSITFVDTIKQILGSNKYAQLLQDGDEKFIPFVLCTYFMSQKDIQSIKFACDRLYTILSDDIIREEIAKKFNFTMKNLRAIYCNEDLSNNKKYSKQNKFKREIKRILRKFFF